MKEKTCPKCGRKFICNHENITECQCAKIKLSSNAQKYIADNYSDCVCANCLKEIADSYK